MRVDVQSLDCDFYVLSGHKMFAPTGIGALFGKSEILEVTRPWQGGGNMIQDVTFEKTIYNVPPARFEAGTGNIGAATGLGAAIDYLDRVGMANVTRHEAGLLRYGTDALTSVPGLRIIGTAREKAGVLSFVLDASAPKKSAITSTRRALPCGGHHCAQPIHRRFGLESTSGRRWRFTTTARTSTRSRPRCSACRLRGATAPHESRPHSVDGGAIDRAPAGVLRPWRRDQPRGLQESAVQACDRRYHDRSAAPAVSPILR